jgi:hypothetical protein
MIREREREKGGNILSILINGAARAAEKKRITAARVNFILMIVVVVLGFLLSDFRDKKKYSQRKKLSTGQRKMRLDRKRVEVPALECRIDCDGMKREKGK